jgi:hypothetical protein
LSEWHTRTGVAGRSGTVNDQRPARAAWLPIDASEGRSSLKAVSAGVRKDSHVSAIRLVVAIGAR